MDTMRYSIFTCTQKLTNSQLSLMHGTKQKGVMNKLKTEMLRRNGPVIKSVELVLRPEGSLWWERFVKKVGLEPGVKEWWVDWVRRCSRRGCSLGLDVSVSRRSRDVVSKRFGLVSVSWKCGKVSVPISSRTENQMSRSRTIGSRLQATIHSFLLHCKIARASFWMQGVYIVYWFTSQNDWLCAPRRT